MKQAAGVRRRKRKASAGLKHAACLHEPADGIVHMLDAVAHCHRVVAFIRKTLLLYPAEGNVQAAATCPLYSTRIEIHAFGGPPQGAHVFHEPSTSGSYIEESTTPASLQPHHGKIEF